MVLRGQAQGTKCWSRNMKVCEKHNIVCLFFIYNFYITMVMQPSQFAFIVAELLPLLKHLDLRKQNSDFWWRKAHKSDEVNFMFYQSVFIKWLCLNTIIIWKIMLHRWEESWLLTQPVSSCQLPPKFCTTPQLSLNPPIPPPSLKIFHFLFYLIFNCHCSTSGHKEVSFYDIG